MNKTYIVIFLFLISLNLYAQKISGYVNFKDSTAWEQKVYLEQIISESTHSKDSSKTIAFSRIDKNGFFSLHNILPKQEHLYRIYINRKKKQEAYSLKNYKLFLFSNSDTIFFKKGHNLFSDYSNTNKADKEWKKLRKFYSKVDFSKNNQQYLEEIRNYSKDSIQILRVKLIGIKELNNKNLLDKDIVLNTKYYLHLLDQLKSSEINPYEYLFLENKLALLAQKEVEKKYVLSKSLNIILSIAIISLLIFIFKSRKKQHKSSTLIDLSKQEKNIRNLILQEKSNKEIANELFISLSTVKTHITSIYNKLKVSNRNELISKFKNTTSTST